MVNQLLNISRIIVHVNIFCSSFTFHPRMCSFDLRIFPPFIKKLNIFELNPQETGDLILCLLIQRVIVENDEDESVQEKYIEDIESICNDQLEGESIYNESLKMANKISQEFRSQSKQ